MTFSRFDAHSEPLFEKLDIMALKNDYFLIALFITTKLWIRCVLWIQSSFLVLKLKDQVVVQQIN